MTKYTIQTIDGEYVLEFAQTSLYSHAVFITDSLRKTNQKCRILEETTQVKIGELLLPEKLND